jgi:hypothetical protein
MGFCFRFEEQLNPMRWRRALHKMDNFTDPGKFVVQQVPESAIKLNDNIIYGLSGNGADTSPSSYCRGSALATRSHYGSI